MHSVGHAWVKKLILMGALKILWAHTFPDPVWPFLGTLGGGSPNDYIRLGGHVGSTKQRQRISFIKIHSFEAKIQIMRGKTLPIKYNKMFDCNLKMKAKLT